MKAGPDFCSFFMGHECISPFFPLTTPLAPAALSQGKSGTYRLPVFRPLLAACVSLPSAFSCVESEFGVASIVSLRNFRLGNQLNQFGGIIFTAAHRTDINSIYDLKGKVSCSSDPRSPYL